MKLLHLGDLHLGKSLGEFDLIEDQKYILNQILDIIDNKSVDAVLIAGDVYDKSIPSEAASNLLDSFLTRLADKNITTFMISGNHDSDDRLNYAKQFFANRNVFISSVFNGKLESYSIGSGSDAVDVYLLPFVKASQVKHFFPDSEIESYEDAVRVIIENTDIDKKKCNILVAHQFVAGKGEDPGLAGSESAGTQNVGLVEKIGYNCFSMFDYVALGHIHSPQRVGRDEVRYAGSPLKYSLSEVNNEKSVPIITVDGGKKVDIELIPLKPMRNLRHIKGEIKDLLSKSNVKSPEDFIYATLTDEDIINDAMGIFQQIYPNTVKIDYEN
jgi:exonuclease SbcD